MHGLMFSSLELFTNWLKIRLGQRFKHELIEILDKMIIDQVKIFLKLNY